MKFYIKNPQIPDYQGQRTLDEWERLIQNRYCFEHKRTAREVVETMLHLKTMVSIEDEIIMPTAA